MDEQVAQYLRPISWLFCPTVHCPHYVARVLSHGWIVTLLYRLNGEVIFVAADLMKITIVKDKIHRLSPSANDQISDNERNNQKKDQIAIELRDYVCFLRFP